MVAVGPTGRRTIKATISLLICFTTAWSLVEILTEVRIPKTGDNKVAYLKVPQSASGFAIVGVAVNLVTSTNGNSTCKSARVGITGLSSHAFRAAGVETELAGKILNLNQ